jgi:puromycin-sensitive aminopeptidase
MRFFLIISFVLSADPQKLMFINPEKLEEKASEQMDEPEYETGLSIEIEELIVTEGEGQRKALDGKVVPEHYDLHVEVEKSGFSGSVGIRVLVREETDTVVLNSNGLELADCVLVVNKETLKGKVEYKDETAIIAFDSVLEAGTEGYLRLGFSGKYGEGMAGFYVSDYNGRPIYSTHFEPTDARKAFPCFDQPDMKATFSISIDADDSLTVLSNSELEKRDGRIRYFRKTEKMSTYLVAYVVGDLGYVETRTSRGLPIRVYAVEEEVSWGNFALSVAKHCVEYYERYFDIEYPFPKIDMVPIPAFAMGAMENWGLITYRKTSLLYNERSSSVSAKKLIAETVCHELAHMWFGNLVTMQWWDDLWLNEGFATWAASMAVDNLPKDLIDWDVWTAFINSDIEQGMAYDALHSTHPIAVSVKDPNDINQIFDSISYSKGASLIRMIEHYMGHNEFRDGIRSYLKEFKYGNANTADLWRHLSINSEIGNMVDRWVNDGGFPLVQVTEEGDKLALRQSRFFLGTKAESKPWIIPVKISYLGKGTESFEFEGETKMVKKKSSLYKLNEGAAGFYRVMYPEDVLEGLLKEQLSDANRLSLINDVFALAFGSYQPIKDRLKLVGGYENEQNYEIMAAILYNLSSISSIFYNDPDVLPYIQGMARDLVSERANRVDLGGAGKTINEISLSSLLVSSAVANRDERMVRKLAGLWERYRRDESTVASDFRRPLHRAVVDEHFEELLEIYKEGKTPESKIIAITALTQSRKEENIRYIMENLQRFDVQDFHYLLGTIVQNYEFREYVVDFVMQNFEMLYKHINNISIFNHVIESVLGSVSTEPMVSKVRSFLSTVRYDGSNRIIRKIDEKIEIREKFRRENAGLHTE